MTKSCLMEENLCFGQVLSVSKISTFFVVANSFFMHDFAYGVNGCCLLNIILILNLTLYNYHLIHMCSECFVL